jgi:hypothetical protein
MYACKQINLFSEQSVDDAGFAAACPAEEYHLYVQGDKIIFETVFQPGVNVIFFIRQKMATMAFLLKKLLIFAKILS